MGRLRFNLSAGGKERREAFQEAPASLERKHGELSRGIVQLSATRSSLLKQRDQAASGINQYRQQAELAFSSGQEDLARGILERKGELEKRLAEVETDLTNLDHQLEIMRQNQLALEKRIATLRARTLAVESELFRLKEQAARAAD
jgi:phage shock protein A